MYYPGKVEAFPSPDKIKIRFDDGDEITHSIEDGTAVIADKAPEKVDVTDHVIARFKGSSKYFIGFVIDETTSGTQNYKVLFDDGDTAWYKAQDLRIFPYMTDKMARKYKGAMSRMAHLEKFSLTFSSSLFVTHYWCSALSS